VLADTGDLGPGDVAGQVDADPADASHAELAGT
jgi:hypothetical protein